ncbi:Rho GDP-dissociation inhibitor 1 [Nymphon striatum]|nr:Rho GDP-dissociation inhibitor 1 [Nymphon striatum]
MSEAEEKEIVPSPVEENEENPDSNYKPPPMKAMDEMLKIDRDDESLVRYKEALLGGTTAPAIAEPDDPRRVIVKKLSLMVDGKPSMELDLTGNLAELKKKVSVIKEGIHYKLKIDFIVQREIVTGLKYHQKTLRKMIPVDKMLHMVGSYGPRIEMHSYTTPMEEAPSGLISRGVYNVKSRFMDDDGNTYLDWDWNFEIKKDWE